MLTVFNSDTVKILEKPPLIVVTRKQWAAPLHYWLQGLRPHHHMGKLRFNLAHFHNQICSFCKGPYGIRIV